MIEDSLSQRSLNFPANKFFTKSASELARQSVAPFASDAVARMHPVLESTIARNVYVSSSTPPIVGSAPSHSEIHGDDVPLVGFQRSESDVRCVDATSQRASFTP